MNKEVRAALEADRSALWTARGEPKRWRTAPLLSEATTTYSSNFSAYRKKHSGPSWLAALSVEHPVGYFRIGKYRVLHKSFVIIECRQARCCILRVVWG